LQVLLRDDGLIAMETTLWWDGQDAPSKVRMRLVSRRCPCAWTSETIAWSSPVESEKLEQGPWELEQDAGCRLEKDPGWELDQELGYELVRGQEHLHQLLLVHGRDHGDAPTCGSGKHGWPPRSSATT